MHDKMLISTERSPRAGTQLCLAVGSGPALNYSTMTSDHVWESGLMMAIAASEPIFSKLRDEGRKGAEASRHVSSGEAARGVPVGGAR